MVTFKSPAGSNFYVDEGAYEATFKDIEEVEGQSFDGKPPQPRNKWVFTLRDSEGPVLDDRGFEMEYHHYTSQATGDRSEARKIILPLLGLTAEQLDGMNGPEIAERILAAKGTARCKVMIADYFRKDGSIGSKAASWSPLQRQAARRGQAPVQQQSAPAEGKADDLDNIPF